MVGSLDIAVGQPVTMSGDIEGNVERHSEVIRSARARVVVFPEMSLTGYDFDAHPVDPLDTLLSPITAACAEAEALALVGAPVGAPGGGRSIGTLMFDGRSVGVAYRKIWLGDTEAKHFVAGTEPAVVEVDGWRLGLAICKDTGVSAHARDTADLGIDIYAVSALEHSHDAHLQPTRARRVAVTHEVWVAVASFAGGTGEGFNEAAGRSGVWRPDGSLAAQAGPHPGEVAVASIDRGR